SDFDGYLTSFKICVFFFFFQAEDGIRDRNVTGVQTCALPICRGGRGGRRAVDGRGVVLQAADQHPAHLLGGGADLLLVVGPLVGARHVLGLGDLVATRDREGGPDTGEDLLLRAHPRGAVGAAVGPPAHARPSSPALGPSADVPSAVLSSAGPSSGPEPGPRAARSLSRWSHQVRKEAPGLGRSRWSVQPGISGSIPGSFPMFFPGRRDVSGPAERTAMS